MKKILVFLLVFFLLGCQEEKKKTTVKNDSLLIDINGNPIPLPKDKLIILNFLAYSCSSCMKEIPILKKVLKEPEFKDKFQIIGIVIDSKKGDFSDPDFPIYPGHNQNFVRFPVPGTPTTYIITPKGKKLIIIYGAVTEKNLRKFLNQALEKAKTTR